MKNLSLQNFRIVKPSFNQQMDSYRQNLLRLLDQEEYWFCERCEKTIAGKWDQVEEIEKIYIEPLNYKINQLVERAPSYEE